MATSDTGRLGGSRGIKPEFDLDPFNLNRALQIHGWMTNLELRWLAEQASRHWLIVELGSFLGRSTRAMADNTQGIVWAIDQWERMDYFPSRILNPWPEFERNLAVHVDSGRVRPIKARHEDVTHHNLPQLRGLDMVFIDGGHERDEIAHDIEVWRPRLIPGGLLCGHDAKSELWPAVDQVLAEMVPDAKFVNNTLLWWTTT